MKKGEAPSLHVGAPPKLRVATLIEALCAVHLSSYVDAPFQERGGLMLVGPPSVLKTTLLEIVSRAYYDAVTVSDINARTLDDLRDQIAAKQIRTLVVPELRKLYERHSQTSSNVEGTIRALVAEGFGAASFNDGRVNQLRARATFMSAMQPKFQVEHFKAWEDSGFNRRFLWALVNMADPHLLDRAVEEWKLIDFPVKHLPPAPVTSLIPNTTTREERSEIRRLVRFQPGGAQSIQMALLVKMLSVLKWWYRMSGRREREAVTAVRDFSAALGKEGAELIL